MAKYTHLETRPIVTLDYGQGPYSYYAASGDRTLGSDGSLFFEHMALTPLSRMSVQDHPVPTEEPTTESGLTNEQQQGLEAVLIAAKGIELQKLHNARAIDAAIREAEKLTADAEHKFNMAVLKTLHTGLTSFTIDAKLEDKGFGDFTEKTDYIGALDTAMLYQTEA